MRTNPPPFRLVGPARGLLQTEPHADFCTALARFLDRGLPSRASPGTAGGTGARARAPAGRSRGGKISSYPAFAVERDAATGYDHVGVRVMGHGRAPGMENRGDADAGTEML